MLLFPIMPAVAASYLFDLLGGPTVYWSGLAPLYTVVPMFIFLTVAAGIGEELGWRGCLSCPGFRAAITRWYQALLSERSGLCGIYPFSSSGERSSTTCAHGMAYSPVFSVTRYS